MREDLFSGSIDDPYRIGVDIDPQRTIAFSGYRRTKLARRGVETLSLGKELDRELNRLYKRGFRTFISGMSDGFDIAAAEATLRLRTTHPRAVRLVAIIPFAGQQEGYTQEDILRYEEILSSANHCWTMAQEYQNSKQYLRRNDLMLHHSSHLLCYFDGERGGTMYTYNRAIKLQMKITNLANYSAE